MSMMTKLFFRLYRLLLPLYPRDFRNEWSDDMLDTLRAREGEVGRKGRLAATARFWLREMAAVIRTALRFRWALTGDALLQDLRFGLRTLRRRLLFTLVAVGTVGLGIGAATAMFSVVEGVLLRPLPYARPGELVQVWQTFPEWRSWEGLADIWDRVTLAWPDYRRWREGQRMFQDVAVYYQRPANLTGLGEPEQIPVGFASSSLLPLLGVRPSLGRGFLPGEDGAGAPAVALISHSFWQGRFGGDRGAVGRVFSLEGQPVEIIGVLPQGFRMRTVGEEAPAEAVVWLPAGALGESLDHGDFNFQALGRLRPGTTLERARSETATLLHGAGGRGVRGARLVPRNEEERGKYWTPLLLLLGASLVLLLIACGNVASLLSGELAGRRHEMAARRALGAPRGRILRQLLTESVLLGLAGSAVGVLLALAGTRTLMKLAPPLPAVADVGVNGTVLAFCAAVGVASGILFAVHPGFRPESLTEVQVQLPFYRYETPEERYRVVREIRVALAAIPGVGEVSATTSLPFSGHTVNTFPEVPGRVVRAEERAPSARRRQVLPGYFETLGIPLLAGRTLSDTDEDGAPGAVVVSESMAERFWPGRSPLGEQVIHGDTFSVVGVVGDLLQESLQDEVYPTFYLTLAQSYRRRPPLSLSFVVRTGAEPKPFFRQFRKAVWSVDADLPVTRVAEATILVTRSARDEGFRTTLLAAFGICAILLAGAGVFGVTAGGVAGRTRELGIRMALGAQEGELVRMVVLRTVKAGGLGLLLGLGGAGAAARLLSAYLFGVGAWDTASYVGAVLFLGLVMVVAAFLPARNAASVEPMEVLQGS